QRRGGVLRADRARTTLADRGFGDDTVTGDAAALALPNGAFDLVTASLVVFLPEPPAAVRRWTGLLKPGGRIALATFGSSNESWWRAESELDPWRSGVRAQGQCVEPVRQPRRTAPPA